MSLERFDLKAYYSSRQGWHVALRLRRTVADFWQSGQNTSNAVIGYGAPLLRADDQAPKLVFLPDSINWKTCYTSTLARSAIVDCRSLPLQNVQLDRLLVVHALEFDSEPGAFLDECWRVLDGAGRILIMVPNRTGVWARSEKTPFGHGRPFTRRQLQQLLQAHGFEPKRAQTVLFMPPSQSGIVLRFGPQIERLGRVWSPAIGGVLVIEAEKQLYAPIASKERAGRISRLGAGNLAPRPTGAMRHFTDCHKNSSSSFL